MIGYISQFFSASKIDLAWYVYTVFIYCTCMKPYHLDTATPKLAKDNMTVFIRHSLCWNRWISM